MSNQLRSIFVCLSIILSHPVAATSLENVSGTLSCVQVADQAVDQRVPCHLQWSLPTTPETSLFIERFDLDTRSWERVSGAIPRGTNTTGNAVQGPGLYRIAGCVSGGNDTDCSYTSVYWVPILPASVYWIPDEVVAQDGSHFIISRDRNLWTQTLQYNLYLMAKLTTDMGDDLGRFPPMTQRQVEFFDFTGDHRTTQMQVLEWQVYMEYELGRTHCHVSGAGCPFTLEPKAPGRYRDDAAS